MTNRLLTILISAILLAACSKVTDENNRTKSEGLPVNLTLTALALNDPLSINQDNTFSNLAIYIYNNDATFTLDKSALVTSFTATDNRDIPLKFKSGSKLIYLIANYAGKTFKLNNGTNLVLTPATTKQELENMVIESSSGLLPTSLLMVATKTMNITAADNGTTINIALRRLQSRIDIHAFKGSSFGTNAVTLQSVTLYNQILNSEVKFDYSASTPQMLPSPMFSTQTIASTATLSQYVTGNISPANAQAILYSYQNLVTQLSPVPTTAPYLEIKVNSAGSTQTYKGYFTDNNQTLNKYSLLQNNIYQITAIMENNAKLVLNMNVLPWDKTDIAYERPITSNDFSFGAWATSWGGINGKTMNTNVGTIEDAVFQFELKAPIGAAWVATLSNGLDFTFASSTAGTTTPTVSSGFTNIGSPYLIAVRATKRWTGDLRDTEFYITVEGNEIPINPPVGGVRRYDGTDTRIKIKQVATYN